MAIDNERGRPRTQSEVASGQTIDPHASRVRYLLSATMYYRPLDLRNRWTNRLKSSTN